MALCGETSVGGVGQAYLLIQKALRATAALIRTPPLPTYTAPVAMRGA